jgi:hypothetical protein
MMIKPTMLSVLAAAMMLFAASAALADKFEAVHAIDYTDASHAKAALGDLMADPAMKGAKVTLYAREFGGGAASHLVVEDFDGYAEYMDSTAKRLASPGWSRYLLQTMADSEYLGSNLAMVVDDHGASRRSAGYLAAFLVNASNDAWFGDSLAPHQHLEIARMRAKETQRYLLRATNTGISAVIAPSGAILARTGLFEKAVLTAEITPLAGATPYVRLGNAAPVGLALLLAVAGAVLARRDRASTSR